MKPIGIPYGTRLVHLERAEGFWRAWTAINSLSVPYHKRRGSFLHLCDDGKAYSVTIHPDGTETVTQIMKGD